MCLVGIYWQLHVRRPPVSTGQCPEPKLFVVPCVWGRCCCAGAAVRCARPSVCISPPSSHPCVHLVHFAFSAHLKAWPVASKKMRTQCECGEVLRVYCSPVFYSDIALSPIMFFTHQQALLPLAIAAQSEFRKKVSPHAPPAQLRCPLGSQTHAPHRS